MVMLTAVGLMAQTSRYEEMLARVDTGQYLPDEAWLIDVDGDTVYYEQFRGKWLIIDYWLPGCRPCIKAFPEWNAFYQDRDSSKVNIINVFVDSSPAQWERRRKRNNIQFPAYYGGWDLDNALLALDLETTYSADGKLQVRTSAPKYVLIDPSGKIVTKAFPKPSDGKVFERLQLWRG